MPLNRLSASKLAALPAGTHSDGGGLALLKRPDGGAQWVWRYTHAGKRNKLGLGAYPGTTLAHARQQAQHWREVAARGEDPSIVRRAEKADRAADTTLATIAVACFEARKAKLKGDGKAGRWMTPLELHVLPKLGKTRVEDLTPRMLKDALQPIWNAKHATARKALNRVGIVIQYADQMDLDVRLSIATKARALLGETSHVEVNIPALHWHDVPAFYASLGDGLSELALRLLILTGLRSTPIRQLRLDWIDGEVLTVPGAVMKGAKGKTANFRVPLSDEAQRVIELARPFAKNGYLFWSQRAPISDMAMSRLMARRGLEARPHGFRSSLRTWLAERTDAPFEVAEAVLAHLPTSEVVKAYARTDYLDRRRIYCQRWADHVTGRASATVVALHG